MLCWPSCFPLCVALAAERCSVSRAEREHLARAPSEEGAARKETGAGGFISVIVAWSSVALPDCCSFLRVAGLTGPVSGGSLEAVYKGHHTVMGFT